MLDRRHVCVYRSFEEAEDYGYMPGTPEERVLQVWELTRDVWAFVPGADPEQRLRRDVAVIIRGK